VIMMRSRALSMRSLCVNSGQGRGFEFGVVLAAVVGLWRVLREVCVIRRGELLHDEFEQPPVGANFGMGGVFGLWPVRLRYWSEWHSIADNTHSCP